MKDCTHHQLTEGEAALLLCIIGVKDGDSTVYPTVEESLRYMYSGEMRFQGLSEADDSKEDGEQLSMFLSKFL